MYWNDVKIFVFFPVTWSNWGAYGACSVTCGDGTKTRTRTCSDPSNTRDVCPGSSSDTTNCNDATCGMYIYVTQLLLITSMWLLNCIGMMINFHFLSGNMEYTGLLWSLQCSMRGWNKSENKNLFKSSQHCGCLPWFIFWNQQLQWCSL